MYGSDRPVFARCVYLSDADGPLSPGATGSRGESIPEHREFRLTLEVSLHPTPQNVILTLHIIVIIFQKKG